MIWTRAFWKALAERAISTGAQVAVAALTVGTFPGNSIPWKAILAAVGIGMLLAALKGIAVNQVTSNGPGLTDAEQVIDVD